MPVAAYGTESDGSQDDYQSAIVENQPTESNQDDSSNSPQDPDQDSNQNSTVDQNNQSNGDEATVSENTSVTSTQPEATPLAETLSEGTSNGIVYSITREDDGGVLLTIKNGNATAVNDSKDKERNPGYTPYKFEWQNDTYRETITKIVIEGSVTGASTSYEDESLRGSYSNDLTGFFAGMTKVTSIEGLENITVDNAMDMFNGCSALTEVTLGDNFDSTKVFRRTFQGCSSLKNVTFTGNAGAAATECFSMFNGCTTLESVSFASGSTFGHNIQYAGNMFNTGSSQLTEISLPSSFGLGSNEIREMQNMFANNSNLQTVIMPTNMNIATNCVTRGMFNSSNLTHVVLPGGLAGLITTPNDQNGKDVALPMTTLDTDMDDITGGWVKGTADGPDWNGEDRYDLNGLDALDSANLAGHWYRMPAKVQSIEVNGLSAPVVGSELDTTLDNANVKATSSYTGSDDLGQSPTISWTEGGTAVSGITTVRAGQTYVATITVPLKQQVIAVNGTNPTTISLNGVDTSAVTSTTFAQDGSSAVITVTFKPTDLIDLSVNTAIDYEAETLTITPKPLEAVTNNRITVSFNDSEVEANNGTYVVDLAKIIPENGQSQSFPLDITETEYPNIYYDDYSGIVAIPARPAFTEKLSVVDDAYVVQGSNNRVITGFDSTKTYQMKNTEGVWETVVLDNGTLTVAPGNYTFRVAASKDDRRFASQTSSIEVLAPTSAMLPGKDNNINQTDDNVYINPKTETNAVVINETTGIATVPEDGASIAYPDDSAGFNVNVPAGTLINPDGSIHLPGGDDTVGNENDATLMPESGASVSGEGVWSLPNGGTVTVPGSDPVVAPNGAQVNPDGSIDLPLAGPDGTTPDDNPIISVEPGHTLEVTDDGVVTVPENTTATITYPSEPDPITVTLPAGTQINQDGTIRLLGTDDAVTTDDPAFTPSNGATTDEEGNWSIPGGGQVKQAGGTSIEIPAAATDEEAAVVHPDGSVTLPGGAQVTLPNEQDPIQVPANSSIDANGKITTTLPGVDGANATTVVGAPAVVDNGDGSVTLTQGGKVTVPGGSTVTAPADTVVKPDGTTPLPDGGSVTNNNGVTITVPAAEQDQTAGTVHPDGSVTLPNGGTVSINGTEVTAPENSVVSPDGTITTTLPGADGDQTSGDDNPTVSVVPGNTVTPNADGSLTVDQGGTVSLPNGATVEAPAGSVVLPDGTIQLPADQDATITLPGDPATTITAPAGSVINPDGSYTISLPGADGVAGSADDPTITPSIPGGATANPDGYPAGSWLLPNGGTVTNADGQVVTVPAGTIVLADGTIIYPNTGEEQPTQPAQDTDKQPASEEETAIPQTSDSTTALPFGVAAAASALAAAFAAFKRRENR